MSGRNPPPVSQRDRRAASRIRPVSRIRGTAGRHPCEIVDMGAGGARIRHSGTLNPGSRVRLQFAFASQILNVEARILATTMTAMGDVLPYVSRLEFVCLDEEAKTGIVKTIASLEEASDLRMIRNARGVVRDYSSRSLEPLKFFLRMDRTDRGWSMVGTVNPAQPASGITVPGDTLPHEAELLRRSWDAADAERRLLIGRMAAAACQGEPPASSSNTVSPHSADDRE